jgi:hypothetical protein
LTCLHTRRNSFFETEAAFDDSFFFFVVFRSAGRAGEETGSTPHAGFRMVDHSPFFMAEAPTDAGFHTGSTDTMLAFPDPRVPRAKATEILWMASLSGIFLKSEI